MGASYICPRCHSAVGLGGMRGDVCAQCARTDRIAEEEAKTVLADDLVRGTTPNSRDSDT